VVLHARAAFPDVRLDCERSQTFAREKLLQILDKDLATLNSAILLYDPKLLKDLKKYIRSMKLIKKK